MHEKDVVGIVTFDLTGLLPSNHIIAYYYNGISEFVTKLSMLTVKYSSNNTKYLRKFLSQRVDSTRDGKLRRLSGRFQTLIWRLGGTVQNLQSPGLSGRVDSPVNGLLTFSK